MWKRKKLIQKLRTPNENHKHPLKKWFVFIRRVYLDFRELGAKMGEIIDIEQQVDENWVQASLRDQIGLIPLTYIEVAFEFST